MRLFIASALPDVVKDELVRVQDLLLDDDTLARCVKRNAMHLTLAFLGNVADDKIDAIAHALDAISFAPIKTSLSGLGAFPDKKHVRVIWAGLDNEDGLLALAEKIQDSMRPLGYRSDHQFSPHLTLCRIKDGKGRDAMQEKLCTVWIRPILFAISTFFLIRSTLTSDGALYTVLAEFAAKKS